MTTTTTNYNLVKYEDSDAPDLTGAYNSSMDLLDTALKITDDKATRATTDVAAAKTDITALKQAVGTDGEGAKTNFTVKELAEAQVTEAGIVVKKGEE